MSHVPWYLALLRKGRARDILGLVLGGQELRAWVGLKEAFCCPPLLFLGVDMTSVCQVSGKRWFRICCLNSG